MTPGYLALQHAQAFVDISGRGRIRVTGEDRARLLHALTTNHVQQMRLEDELYAFFLTAQGKIVSDAHIVSYEDNLLVDVDAAVVATVLQHIDHYIIADDAAVEDITDQTFALKAAGKRIYGPVDGKAETIAGLGLTEATLSDARVYRIERFHPRFLEDFSQATLPQETGLTYALHFNKGCYLGQEIVERVRSRGQIHRMLCGLSIEGAAVPEPGAPVTFEGAEMGKITSAIASPTFGIRALAMLRTQASKPGASVEVGGASALVSAVS